MGILDKLTKDDLFLSKEDAMQWDEWEKNTIYNDGVKEGIEQGIVQNTTEMILSMLKNDIDIGTISKITNKSIKEIETIKKQENL